jgi:hypothetical protein
MVLRPYSPASYSTAAVFLLTPLAAAWVTPAAGAGIKAKGLAPVEVAEGLLALAFLAGALVSLFAGATRAVLPTAALQLLLGDLGREGCNYTKSRGRHCAASNTTNS